MEDVLGLPSPQELATETERGEEEASGEGEVARGERGVAKGERGEASEEGEKEESKDAGEGGKRNVHTLAELAESKVTFLDADSVVNENSFRNGRT